MRIADDLRDNVVAITILSRRNTPAQVDRRRLPAQVTLVGERKLLEDAGQMLFELFLLQSHLGQLGLLLLHFVLLQLLKVLQLLQHVRIRQDLGNVVAVGQ